MFLYFYDIFYYIISKAIITYIFSLDELSNLYNCGLSPTAIIITCYESQYISVCLRSDTHVRMLEDCIQETLMDQNKLAAGSDRYVPSENGSCSHR